MGRYPLVLALLLASCRFDTTGLQPASRDLSRRAEGGAGDARLDATRPGERGCAAGLIVCGGVCIDPMTAVAHCGGCGEACDPASTDRCAGGRCVCGTAADACAAGLDCRKGSCACVVGGRCKGCCDQAVCRPGTVPQACGVGGAACASCDDKNPCTADSCAGASCLSAPLSGAVCDDGNYCTTNDSCAVGGCVGLPRDCSTLNDACNTGVCDEAADLCRRVPKKNGTSCGGQDRICVNGKCIEVGDP